MAIDSLEEIQAADSTQWIRVRGADASNPVLLVLWCSIRVVAAVLAAVRVQAGPPRRWHVYGLAASPAGWGAEPASGVSSRYLIS